MSRRLCLALMAGHASPAAAACADLYAMAPDLELPPMTDESPAAGRRVRHTLAAFGQTQVHHALYLPRDWKPGRRFPVLVEYAGNGGYHNANGDRCLGTVDDSALGYGISAGRRFLWICLPYVDASRGVNALTWWGDIGQTAAYCRQAVDMVCRDFGGDPSRVFLLGFSRGAIACNYVGLHDDAIARIWRGFVAHSHYDGVRTWDYPESEREFALRRLGRLNGRPVFISHECSVENTRAYLQSSGVAAPFHLVALPFRNHTDRWVLRGLPERRQLRRWIARLC
jgi:hypothetical protein